MRVVSLGSGSSGNSLLVQTGKAAVLVDAGFGVRALTTRLRQAGVTPSMISAILLTHEHGDHACGSVAFAAQHHIPLVADPLTIAAVLSQSMAVTTATSRSIAREELPAGRSLAWHDLTIRSFPISHDAVAPCGYVLSTGAWSVCVATDTGTVLPGMVEAMRGAHLLVLEANHDKERLLKGPYPWVLKRRILSDTGHLSNEQSSEALAQSLDDGPRWIWLAHLSKTNNTPDLARGAVRGYLRARGLGHVKLEVCPPALGPSWDSATLLGGVEQPRLFADVARHAPEPKAAVTAAPLTHAGE